MEPPETVDRDRELSALYHAMMNPMTVVLGYAQLLSTRRDLQPDVREQVQKILEEARTAVRIIESARARRASPSESPAPAPAAVEARRTRVLVVDDEPVLLKLVTEALGAEHEVVAVSTAGEAERLMLSQDFDAVLLDMTLAGETSGQGLYEVLQARHPDLAGRVVFVTGGILDPAVQEFVLRTGRDCLQKPFHLRALREVVARVAGS